MQTLKVALVLAGLLALTRYIPVYYSSHEFNYFVRHEAARSRSEVQLKEAVLEQARAHALPVKESDISIDRTDAVVRVTVDYAVPVNLLVYNPQLKFHVTGGGLLPEAR
jgi:hypothetical protein